MKRRNKPCEYLGKVFKLKGVTASTKQECAWLTGATIRKPRVEKAKGERDGDEMVTVMCFLSQQGHSLFL